MAPCLQKLPFLPSMLSKQAFLLSLAILLSLPLGFYSKEATLSRHCLENPLIVNSNYGAGSIQTIGGLKAYVSGHLHSKLAILLLSNIYGYEAPHLRDIADKVAKFGFYAVVLDFFSGDPYVDNSSRTFKEWLGLSGNVVVKMSKNHHIKAAVLLHPSWVTLHDIKAVKVPLSILASGLDNGTPTKLLKRFKKALSKNKVDNFIKIFPKVEHGWTIRYNKTNPAAVKAFEKSHQDMLHWLTKYLKKT